MNSVANGKVALQSPFRKMYLPAAAGDAGGAIGAAFVVWKQERGSRAQGSGFGVQSPESGVRSPESKAQDFGSNGHFVMRDAYTGPHFGEEAVEGLLKSRGLLEPSPESEFSCTRHSDVESLCKHTAKAISEGKVVGWFQGRMEWGPRALGNRSILGDPRRADMKDILNAKIKRRESFRPFAPSILRERVGEWFEQDDDVPFMMQVFQVRENKRKLVPATTHVDGSGRLHTVSKEANPLYHRLISEFFGLTGVPMVLNTSFNENEPVVCRPEEALDCFLRTRMDLLVLSSFFLERRKEKEEGRRDGEGKMEKEERKAWT
jgi:carbamoyltransferase